MLWQPPVEGEAINLQIETPPAEKGKGDAKSDKEDKGEKPAKGDATAERPGTLLVPRLDQPGLHRFSWKAGKDGFARTLLIAANPDAAESDLAKASNEEALKALSPWKASIVRDVDEMPSVAAEAKPGREMPVLLLLTVLALLFAESFLSNRLYQYSAEQGEAAEDKK
ncbi:MAG: hypothetical protein HY291_03590 [Planctomycetes bacterium]|nr:hypothetical protein [Planctomycetota bacterium]